MLQHFLVAVAVDVDETGRDSHPRALDLGRARHWPHDADVNDVPPRISTSAWRAGAPVPSITRHYAESGP
jgi:hypothetical protein